MHFLFLTPRLHNNYQADLKALVDHGHQATVGVLYTLPTERYDIVQPVVLGYALSFLWLKRLFQRKTRSVLKDRFELRYGFPPLRALWRLVQENQADVVVIKNIDSAYSLLAMCFARLLGKQILVSLQIEKYRPQSKSGSVDFVGKIFDARVITPLLGDPRYSNENGNLYYIPFTQSLDSAPKPRMDRTSPIRILCVAKFQKRKNQLLLLQALQTLPKTLQYELHFVGQRGEPEYLKAVEQYILEKGMADQITIQLDLPWEQMQDEYRWADVYVLPSAREPAAVSLLEAMSFGLPVVCSDQNGTKCYIVEGENGCVFRSGDAEALAQLLSKLLSDRRRLEKMGKKSLELVQAHHVPEKTYEQFMQVVLAGNEW